MHGSVENDMHRPEDERGDNVSGGKVAQRASASPASRNGHGQSANGQSIPDAVAGFIERNPVIAAGAALAVGAAVVMAVQSRRSASHRIDRRVQRAVRSMDQAFTREMKALRRSDAANRLGQFGSSLGDAFSRIDLSPLAERGREYLEEARRRFGA